MNKDKFFFLPNKNLPKNGWLQSCINCSAITSRVIFLKHADNGDLYFFLCYECKRKKLDKCLEFHKQIQANFNPVSLD